MKNLLKSVVWFIRTANYYYGFDFRCLKHRWIRGVLKFKYFRPEKVILTEVFSLSGLMVKNSTPPLLKEMKKRAEYQMEKKKQCYGVFVETWVRYDWVELPSNGDFIQYQLLVEGTIRQW